jgi:hypothetical protein
MRRVGSILAIISGLLMVSAGGCARVSQNESAIQTTNGCRNPQRMILSQAD